MPDLRTEYLGLELRSPLVASAGPHTGNPDKWAELDAAGVGAIVLPSLFEELIEQEMDEIDNLFSLHADSFGEAGSFMPEVDGFGNVTDNYLSLVESAKKAMSVPVIASLNGTHAGGWLRYAKLLEEAGADAIELNLYVIGADSSVDAATSEAEQLEVIRTVSETVDIPINVKLSPFYSSLANFLVQVEQAGAAGVALFNRFYAPDIDLETLDIDLKIALSNQNELRLPLRWIGIAHSLVSMSIAGTTGVHCGRDAAKLILAGADVAMSTSALLFHGPSYISTLESELVEWMKGHNYESVSEMRGAVSRDSTADPDAYERANYIINLRSYASRFLSGRSVPRLDS